MEREEMQMNKEQMQEALNRLQSHLSECHHVMYLWNHTVDGDESKIQIHLFKLIALANELANEFARE
jgi:hypothetical protein